MDKITTAPTQNEIINKVNEIIDGKQDTLIAGTDLEIINSTTPRLPAGFTELEWLQSDGACCIDLGVISYGNDEVEQKFQRPGTFSGDVISWFGSIQNSAVPRFSIGASSSSGIFAGFNFTKPLVEYDNNIHIITLKKIGSTYYAGIDGEVVSYAPTSASTNPSINSYLFARNGSTITYDGTGTRIFYHKQNRFGGTPLLDIVPARRDSDNALGIYNLVSNTFSGNIGTGTLTGGPEVIYPTTTTINFTNESGYITGINSSDVITALGYTPYDSTNPDNYTSNVGTVTSVNNTQPDANGNVTIQAGGATDVQINGTSITSGGVANIVTNTAYNATSNKIATMSDLPSTSGFLENTATGSDALTILGNPTSYLGGLNIGSYSTASNNYGIAIGNGTSTTYTSASGASSIAIGHIAKATAECSIQIGAGTNSTARTVYIGGWDSGGSPKNYQILDIETGLIPDARISTNIARTSQIPSTSGLANTSLSNLSSTGKKVIDGQWVAKETSLTTSTAINTYTLDLVNYLPSGGGKYEVLVACNISSNKTSPSNTRLYSDVISISTNYLNQKTPNTSHSLQAGCLVILPVTRYLYFKIENSATASTTIIAEGYRRIGTNT